MVDFSSETLITLREAAKLLPARRACRPVSQSCIFRWTEQGCKGIRLAYTKVGSTRCTSREAMQRFFDALTAREEAAVIKISTPEPCRLPAHRRQAIDAAVQRLEKAGV